jgi:hypothetical protein
VGEFEETKSFMGLCSSIDDLEWIFLNQTGLGSCWLAEGKPHIPT